MISQKQKAMLALALISAVAAGTGKAMAWVADQVSGKPGEKEEDR